VIQISHWHRLDRRSAPIDFPAKEYMYNLFAASVSVRRPSHNLDREEAKTYERNECFVDQ
jgi:hypothetical protein